MPVLNWPRRTVPAVITAGLFLCSACDSPANPDAAAEEVRSAVKGFLRAFENGDLDRMRDSFASDAVTFPRAIMQEGLELPVKVENFRRVVGLDPQMAAVIAGIREVRPDPPFFQLNPRDLQIRLFDNAALVTFHLEWTNAAGVHEVGRRTFVLENLADGWKVVHLHASSVRGSL